MPSKSVQNLNEVSAALDKLKVQLTETTQLATNLQGAFEKMSLGATGSAGIPGPASIQGRVPAGSPQGGQFTGPTSFVMGGQFDQAKLEAINTSFARQSQIVKDLTVQYEKLFTEYQNLSRVIPPAENVGTVRPKYEVDTLMGATSPTPFGPQEQLLLGPSTGYSDARALIQKFIQKEELRIRTDIGGRLQTPLPALQEWNQGESQSVSTEEQIKLAERLVTAQQAVVAAIQQVTLAQQNLATATAAANQATAQQQSAFTQQQQAAQQVLITQQGGTPAQQSAAAQQFLTAQQAVAAATQQVATTQQAVAAATTAAQQAATQQATAMQQVAQAAQQVANPTINVATAVQQTIGNTQNLGNQLQQQFQTILSNANLSTQAIQQLTAAYQQLWDYANTPAGNALVPGLPNVTFGAANPVGNVPVNVGPVNLGQGGNMAAQAFIAGQQGLMSPQQNAQQLANYQVQKQLMALNNIAPGGTLPIQTAIQKFGFQLTDLKSVSVEASTGVVRSMFQMSMGGGIMSNLSVTTNKWGETLVDTQRRFRSFGDQIFSDIGKVAQWGAAVALIYTPMYKLGQLLNDAVAIQAKLSEAMRTVVAGSASEIDVFNASAEAANKAGEAVAGVVDGYAEAYRATGSIINANERLTTTSKLLADSLTLAKLSGLSQADSIDVLSAALKQLNRPLSEGSILLDQWLALGKIANVDLSTLAVTMATVGDAADAAGIDITKLNDITAILAESLNYGDQQIANTVRAVIAGFQSQQAIKALNDIGIATEDLATGTQKSVSTILNELNRLYTSGALSKDQLSDLSLILGGGSRRQAAVSTLISRYGDTSSWDKQIALMNTAGLSEQQLAIQTNNVQTAITKLGNAFSSLAIGLGVKGGLLDTFSSFITLLTGIVTGVSGASNAIGKITPLLVLIGGATAYLGSRPVTQQASIARDVGNTVTGGLNWLFNNSAIAQAVIPQGATPATNAGKSITSFLGSFGQQNLRQSLLTGGLVSALPAISSATSGDFGRAGAELFGGIFGSLVSNGKPIGAIIGVAIAEAFVNAASYKPQWENLFSTAWQIPESTLPINQQTPEQAQQTATNTIFGGGLLGTFFKTNSETIASLSKITGLNITPEQIGLVLDKVLRPEQYKAAINAIQQANLMAETSAGVQGQVAQVAQTQFIAQYGDTAKQIIAAQQQALLQQVSTGEITPSQYSTASTSISNLETKASVLLPELGDQLKDLLQGSGINDTKDAINALAEIIEYDTPDAINSLNSLADAVANAVAGGNPQEIATAQKNLADAFKFQYEQSKQAREDLVKELTISQENLTPAQLPDLEKQYQARMQYLQQNFGAGSAYALANPGYEFKGTETPQIVEFSDGTMKALSKYWPVWQDLLSKIVDNTSKIEGVYNLPSGAEFFVPFQGYKAGDFGGSVDANTLATDNNTSAINNLSVDYSRMTGTYLPANNLPSQYSGMTGTYLPTSNYPSQYSNMTGTYLPANAPTTETPNLGEQILTAGTNFNADVGKAAQTLADKIEEGFSWVLTQFGFGKSASVSQYPAQSGGSDIYLANQMPQTSQNTSVIVPQSYRMPTTAPLSNSVINVQPVAKLSLTLETRTNLILDGKQVAAAVSKYMADNLTSKTRSIGSNVSLNII